VQRNDGEDEERMLLAVVTYCLDDNCLTSVAYLYLLC
jgi:hypothetical protein